MKYVEISLRRGLMGIPLGVFISQIILIILIMLGKIDSVTTSIIIEQFIVSSIVGFYFASISIIYEVDEWSLLKQTIIHAIANIPFFPIAIYAGWIENNLKSIIIYFIIYILIYMCIWMSITIYWRNKTKIINKKLNNNDN